MSCHVNIPEIIKKHFVIRSYRILLSILLATYYNLDDLHPRLKHMIICPYKHKVFEMNIGIYLFKINYSLIHSNIFGFKRNRNISIPYRQPGC